MAVPSMYPSIVSRKTSPTATNTTGVTPNAWSATTPSDPNTAVARLTSSTLASRPSPTPRRSPVSRRSAIVTSPAVVATIEHALQLEPDQARGHQPRPDDVAEHQAVEAHLHHGASEHRHPQ